MDQNQKIWKIFSISQNLHIIFEVTITEILERLERFNVNSVRYRTKTISHLGQKSWNILSEEYKEIDSLSI